MFSAVMISAPMGCSKSLHRPKNKTIHLLVSEIVLCTMLYASSKLKDKGVLPFSKGGYQPISHRNLRSIAFV